MDLSALFKRAGKVAADNSPAILTAIGVTGTLTTAYLAAKAGFKSVEALEYAKFLKRNSGDSEDDEQKSSNRCGMTPEEKADPLTNQEKVEAVWQLYIPAAASAALTVAAIITAVRVENRRTAALASAYSVVEKGFEEYRAKVADKIGKTKEQTVRDEIAQDRVNNTPVTKTTIVVTKDGAVDCFDAWSGRYFASDMETIRKAVNDINWQILHDSHASLTDFWDKVGLVATSESDELGWNSDREFVVDYSTVLNEKDRPCIVISFRYPPLPLFYRNTY